MDGISRRNNVVIVDPNQYNINPNIVNGIPQYQDMFIFAEFTANRKGRTVLLSKGGFEKNNMEDSISVNFLGMNQEKNNPNYLNFTTNYYDGSLGSDKPYESFGMTNIKITINSSFVPQVNIQFVDARGLSFFNQEDSPYRVLIDFPPPIFTLTIKGYYGKALTYKLHLVKQTSEFKSESGNFVIDAQFVAITYAPLSDILFRYIVNFPLMISDTIISPDLNVPPKNTYDLISKLKNLYAKTESTIKTDIDSKKFDNTKIKTNQINSTTIQLSSYTSQIKDVGKPYFFIKTNESSPFFFKEIENEITINSINNLSEYDEIIRKLSTDGLPTNIKKRLYVGYIVGTNSDVTNAIQYSSGNDFSSTIENELNSFSNKLIMSAKNNVTNIIFNNSDISQPIFFENTFNLETKKNENNPTKYGGIDVTDFYVKLFNEKNSLNKERDVLSETIKTKINNSVVENLGMFPTIYNIFKIILDDIDTFFEIVKKTSEKAESEHHNNEDYKKIILNGNYKDVIEKVFAFPLVIDKKPVYGGFNEVRVAPIELSEKLPEPFPEITLVNDFIDTFFTQQKREKDLNMKSAQNADGSNTWIPISPYDSQLGSVDVTTPYFGVDTASGNAPINTSSDSSIVQVLKILLNRFYILSQNVLSDMFYITDNSNKSFINLHAQAEAINLIASINNTNLSGALKEFTKKYVSTEVMNNFYTYLNSNVKDYYDFIGKEYLNISIQDKVYVNKLTNENFVGVKIVSNEIIAQTSNSSNDPINVFQESVRKNVFESFFNGRRPENYYQFTNENVVYVRDDSVDRKGEINTRVVTKYDNVNLDTRYVADLNSFMIDFLVSLQKSKNRENMINDFYSKGNRGWSDYSVSTTNSLNKFNNVIDIWVNQLSKCDTKLYNILTTTSKLSALLFLSNFGYTLSPFNKYSKNLNDLVFTVPAAIEVPQFLSAYVGLLCSIDSSFITALKEFFINGDGNTLSTAGVLIFADIKDVNDYLSKKDKEAFKLEYDNFELNYLKTFTTQFLNLYNDVQKSVGFGKTKEESYEILLNPNESINGVTYFNKLIKPILEKTTILNFSQLTFKMSKEYDSEFSSLKKLNENSNKKNINNTYFSTLFNEINTKLVEKEKDVEKSEEENKKMKGDEDIVTQTYYSFKNVNDKWLSNPNNRTYGYPFNFGENSRLINSFAFVDRALNPIGDTILDCSRLIEAFDDPNVSVFTVLTQLLSSNGFEFFPIQNFMSYSENDWEKSFKIETGDFSNQSPCFVCMYIGGSSSYPTTIKGDFKDDGISDLEFTDAPDFNTSENGSNNSLNGDEQTIKNTNFPYRQVRAFRVRFGEQNQSMFTNIKINSKEYPETNESIQILSRLARDNEGGVSIPKGQNLYNLYENRAYSATVEGLGNAMIQPTQYFQLENIPMYNGAYLITSVEHNIIPNTMTTSFSGTKIVKYTQPRVTEPATMFGFVGGSSDETIGSSSVQKVISEAVMSSNGNPNNAKYQSMYELKIE